MSGGGSVRGLLLRVVIVAAVLLGLARWTGRGARPGSGGPAGAAPPAVPAADADQMSAPGDLTFYRTLGSAGPATARVEGPAAGGGSPAGALPPNKDTGKTTSGSAGAPMYVLQVTATRDAGVARRMRDRLAARGFPALVLEDRSGAQAVFRVRAGRYLTRAEAEAAARVLRKQGLRPWVLQEGQ